MTSKEILIDDRSKTSNGFNSAYNRFRNSFNFHDEDEDDIYEDGFNENSLSADDSYMDSDDKEIRDWKRINKPRVFQVIRFYFRINFLSFFSIFFLFYQKKR